jgi:hypothetical protein
VLSASWQCGGVTGGAALGGKPVKSRGFNRLRDFAYEVDVQEPVLQPCALDLKMIGEREATLVGKQWTQGR